jgi:electron transfer flavoprotein beta subunit
MTTHIIVCIKSVVKSAPKGVARRTPDNSELNPFDRPALEAAIRVRESRGGRVTVLSMGPPVAAEALAEALAMGADRAVLISDRALADSDTLVTSRVLAGAVQKIGPFDLLLFGTRTADSDTGQVGPQTAALLELPFVSRVTDISAQAGRWAFRRIIDLWEECWEADAPAVATIDAGAFRPRPLELGQISAVYDGQAVEHWDLNHLGMTADRVGPSGSPTRVAALEKVSAGRGGEMIEGEPGEQAERLISRLVRDGLIG